MENFPQSSQINSIVASSAWTFSPALDFEPEENLTQKLKLNQLQMSHSSKSVDLFL